MSDAWAPDEFDRPREACGVVGTYTLPERRVDVARVAYFGLFALQHRGQESAGIAVSDGRRSRIHRGMGLVSQVFTEDALSGLTGHIAIGHNRYSTTGTSTVDNAQPYRIDTLHGIVAVAHNGNVTNAAKLRRTLFERGVGLVSTSDSEVLTQMLAQPAPGEDGAPDWPARFERLMAQVEGAFSLVVLTPDAVYALRDPLGMRPLCLGDLPDEEGTTIGYLAASESAAFGTIGARHLREVRPGEVVRLDRHGITVVRQPEAKKTPALCIFEYVYFSRPDSVVDGRVVDSARQALGAQLAKEHPVEADIVIPVPDSATSAALGFAAASGIPFGEGLMKNRYIGRTFIQPTDQLRRASIRLKFNPIRANIEGKRVVLIDDSIVRGNTMGKLVDLLRSGGAREVHVRISSPPVRNPCFMGVDLATHEQLIAHRMSEAGICRHVGADSLGYLSVEGMRAAVQNGRPAGHCAACFDGAYPIDVSALSSQKSGAWRAPTRG
ncbi:MAG: amidophosphoribosyltransferase [Bradymonadia bacterium]